MLPYGAVRPLDRQDLVQVVLGGLLNALTNINPSRDRGTDETGLYRTEMAGALLASAVRAADGTGSGLAGANRS